MEELRLLAFLSFTVIIIIVRPLDIYFQGPLVAPHVIGCGVNVILRAQNALSSPTHATRRGRTGNNPDQHLFGLRPRQQLFEKHLRQYECLHQFRFRAIKLCFAVPLLLRNSSR